jgi:hypothetical protein
MKHVACSITMDCEEGKGHRVTLRGPHCWTDANTLLRGWWGSAPPRGYDKCHFSIVFVDGHEYEGRLDIVRDECPDLSRHVHNVAYAYAGLRCPPGMSDAHWHEHLRVIGDNAVREWRELCERYQLGPLDKPGQPAAAKP